MRILIVEDNNNKLKQIREYIESQYKRFDIHDAVSYTGGLRRIYDEQWDIILLDMTLPVYDVGMQDNGGDKKSIAGKEIMQRMLNRGIVVPTIIITQFDTFGDNEVSIEQLNELFGNEMQSIWRGTVNYEASGSRWKDALRMLISKVLEEKNGKNTDC